jgi:hypothetical protein
MNRLDTINTLMRRVHKAVSRSRPRHGGSRGFYSVSLRVPGLASDLSLDGVDVQDLLVPDVEIPEADKLRTLSETIALLGDPLLDMNGRRVLRGELGKLVLDFALLGSTPEERYARLLWAFGKKDEKEVGDNTLIIKGALGDYGVRDGVIIGGAFNGVKFNISTESITEKERTVVSRSVKITEIRRVLHDKVDQEAMQIFCLLFSLSEWDERIILSSLLMPRPKIKVERHLNNLSTEVMESDEPYMKLYRSLVPLFMTCSDFRSTFGSPEGRGSVGQNTRVKLINKMYMLPFFG